MIQRRQDGQGWSADTSVTTASADDLQSLVEAVVQRYRLLGAVVASKAGDVRARVGPSLEAATDGFLAALAGHGDSLAQLAAAIEEKTLPRYFSQGELDAFADLPKPGLVALFIRKRPETSQRSELEFVSDYNVAKEMTLELRNGIERLGIA
jgi:hypothetical protein